MKGRRKRDKWGGGEEWVKMCVLRGGWRGGGGGGGEGGRGGGGGWECWVDVYRDRVSRLAEQG